MLTAMNSADLLLQNFPARTRTLRIAMVTETYPPEINGVAMTMGRIVAGLQARGHAVQLIRPGNRCLRKSCSAAFRSRGMTP